MDAAAVGGPGTAVGAGRGRRPCEGDTSGPAFVDGVCIRRVYPGLRICRSPGRSRGLSGALLLMSRRCPLCSRRLECVVVKDRPIHCCPNCSIAWRPGSGDPTVSHATAGSGISLLCPDCGDRVLAPMGATALREEWRCLACHGRLGRLAAASISPPPQEASARGEVAGVAVEVLAHVAEFFLAG
jgi:hypothetical protein